MSSHIGIKYTLTKDSYNKLCSSLHKPQTIKKCPNHQNIIKGTFCEKCGTKLIPFPIAYTQKGINEEVWETELDPHGFYWCSEDDAEENILFYNIYKIEKDFDFTSIQQIQNLISNSELDEELSTTLDKFATKEIGVMELPY